MGSKPDAPGSRPVWRLSLRVVAVYAGFCLLWILLSDQAAARIFSDPDDLTRAQTIKGWFFVTVSSVVLYWVVRSALMAHADDARTKMDLGAHLLQENAERFRALVQHGHEGVVIIEPSGKILYESPANVDIIKPPRYGEEGRNGFENLHPDDLSKARSLLERVMGDPSESATVELRAHDSEGRWRWLSITATNMRDNPNVGGIVINFRDVTEQRSLEESLRLSQRVESVGAVVGGVAHDFNNLLTVIINHAHLAREELPSDSVVAADLEAIERASSSATQLIHQLRTYSGNSVLHDEVTDAAKVIENLMGMLRTTLGATVDVEVRLAEDLPHVAMSPAHFEQVVMNLVINARDAMSDGGWLLVLLDRKDEDVRLTVVDSGPGVAPEIQDRIFEPFFTTKKRGQGTGLGLSTVYGIVRQAGGDISVGTPLGSGASFTVRLPAAAELGKEPAAREKRTLHGPSMRVVVIEDNDALRDSVVRMIGLAGHEVTAEFPSASDAIKDLDQLREVDAILSDIEMPGLSGRKFVAHIRSAGLHVPVVLMSGFVSDPEEFGDDPRRGAFFIQKPFSASELEAVLQECRDQASP